jgi:hypothetical protein
MIRCAQATMFLAVAVMLPACGGPGDCEKVRELAEAATYVPPAAEELPDADPIRRWEATYALDGGATLEGVIGALTVEGTARLESNVRDGWASLAVTRSLPNGQIGFILLEGPDEIFSTPGETRITGYTLGDLSGWACNPNEDIPLDDVVVVVEPGVSDDPNVPASLQVTVVGSGHGADVLATFEWPAS